MPSPLCALILAAGLSTRMEGKPKALCLLDGTTLLQRAVALFATTGVTSCFVVTGHQHNMVQAEAARLNAEAVYNPAYHSGMFSSIQAGVEHIRMHHAFSGCFLLPVDVALAAPAVPAAVQAAWQSAPAKESSIVLPATNGMTGHPPLIGSAHFLPITLWQGENGLRGYMASLCSPQNAALLLAGRAFTHEADAAPLHCVAVADTGMLHDMDTPHDLAIAEEYCRAAKQPGQTNSPKSRHP